MVIVAIAMATGLSAKCSLLYALIVASRQKYHSSHAKTGQCIAAIATEKLDQVDKFKSTPRAYIGWVYLSLCIYGMRSIK